MAIECAVSCVDGDVKGVKRKFNCIKQFWHRYLLLEPALILFWAPTLFRFDKFVTYKACRFSLGYNEAVCSAVLYENKDDSDCYPYNYYVAITIQGPSAEELFVDASSPNFNFAVCKAEDQARNLVHNVFLNTLPIVSIIPYIILMFAGGWADRYNKRKAFLILPILGRCLHYIFQLTSSIYRESLPFGWAGWYFAIIPNIFGGVPCFLMSAFSYITITTPESDRVLRIGILSVFVLLTNFLSGIIGHLINSEFSKYFGICVGLEIAAILYIILFIKEPKSNESVSEVNDSAGDIQLTNLDDLPIQKNVTDIESSSEPSRRNVLKEFFDPMFVVELFKLPFKRRHNNDRLILLLLILCYFLTAGPETIETIYMDFHILNRLDSNENLLSYYILMKFMISINLTFFGIIAFTKIWKFSDSIVGISDSLIGILTAVFVVVSRVLFYFAGEASTVYYVFDLSLILRLIPIKSLASILNEGDGKLFSFFGILEAVAILPFLPIYDAFVDAIGNSYSTLVFLFSEVFYVPNVLIFIACYFLMRRRNSNLAQQDITECL